MIEENSNNSAALQVLGRSLVLLIKIYYDLNTQDLPEFFEDNLAPFVALFQKYLVYSNPLLTTEDEDEEGILEQIKTGICYILELYASRYEDAFPQLDEFVPIVIGLLNNAGPEPKYDTVSERGMDCCKFHVLMCFFVDGLQGILILVCHCEESTSFSSLRQPRTIK